MLSPFLYHGIEHGPCLSQTQAPNLQNTKQESDIPQKGYPPRKQRPFVGLVLLLGSGSTLEVALPIKAAFPLLALSASVIIAAALARLTLPVELPAAKGTKKILTPSVAGSRQKGDQALPAPAQNKPSSSLLLQDLIQELLVLGTDSPKL